MKLVDQIVWHEIAVHENTGHEKAGHENARQKNANDKNYLLWIHGNQFISITYKFRPEIINWTRRDNIQKSQSRVRHTLITLEQSAAATEVNSTDAAAVLRPT